MDEIIHKRKQVIFLKRYFEPLEDITEQLSDSGSEAIPKDMEKHFIKLSGKAMRNNKALGNLRDYITQVREAWQAQIDIRLNSIMKIFTVVSTIFFPLSLIASWYGMNFRNMPEISWKFGYVLPFGLSIMVVAISLWFFRKNRYI